jgi:endonuclease/exonuclease/phosphatase (EEP) superfamily protein YafD
VKLFFVWLPLCLFYLTTFRQWFFIQETLAGFHHYLFIYSALLCFAMLRQFWTSPRKLKAFLGVLVVSIPFIRSIFFYLPYYVSRPVQTMQEGALPTRPISFFFANKYLRNDETAWFDELLNAQMPDIVALAETDSRWVERAKLQQRYPYRASVFDQSVWGLELFSKYPFIGQPQTDLGPDVPGFIHATVNVQSADSTNSQPLHLVIFHLPPPISAARWEQARNMTRRIATQARHDKDLWIVAGDFNSSPAGRVSRSFMKASRLVDAFYGHGFHTTWNQDVWFLQTMIDRAFVSPQVKVEQANVVEIPGGDHRGLFLQLQLPGMP